MECTCPPQQHGGNRAYDVPCAPALAKIAREAGQPVPDWLEKWAKKAGSMKRDKNWAV